MAISEKAWTPIPKVDLGLFKAIFKELTKGAKKVKLTILIMMPISLSEAPATFLDPGGTRVPEKNGL